MAQIDLSQLFGVGPKTIERLEKLGITSLQDLLFHLPFRYEDRTQILSIRSLQIGKSAGIVGVITATEIVRHGRTMFLCQLTDETGSIKLRFFNYARQRLQFLFKPGIKLYCYGEVHYFGTGYEMVHPEYKILKPDAQPPIADSLTPIYPTTEGLSQIALQKIIAQALAIAEKHAILEEYLPTEILNQLQFPEINIALHNLHHPPKDVDPITFASRDNIFRQRLIFEELLAQQLSLMRLRGEVKRHTAPVILWELPLYDRFLKNLSFTLTQAQQKVVSEIAQDLQISNPMLRLLQGDVGCGKTVVAAIAILQVVNSGYQAAIMAPTELLAEQHYQNILAWLAPFNITTCLVTGKTKGKTRDAVYAEIIAGSTKVIVGTHAIFQEQIQFANLGLIIIDEQHRFGVHQRLALREKGFNNGVYPHQLIMTATPIPRTLTMAVYADLDLSVIDELPKGRMPVKTVALHNSRRNEVIARVYENCKSGRQAYWVCSLIEESEILQCQAAELVAKELTISLPQLKVGLIHGRMKDHDKTKIMRNFKAGELDLLVATTVIEVGVDVPNASLMVIENSERLGLVQLHQLRGRIGRGTVDSYCVLLYQQPLSINAGKRLQIMRSTNDGFVLAQKDLEMRGPGDILGVQQTGILQMRVADLLLDKDFVPQVQKVGELLTQKYPGVVTNLINRWLVRIKNYSVV